MISLTAKKSIILFDIAFYTQVKDVAMGSQLGPSLAMLSYVIMKQNG